MKKQISEDALKVIGTLTLHEEGVDTVARITAGQLDRKIYTEVNTVLEMLGGNWNKKAKGHIFESDVNLEDALATVYATGSYINDKKLFQFYETPAVLAQSLAEQLDVRSGDVVLEPSAGRGALLKALDLTVDEAISYSFVAVELDPKNIEALRTEFDISSGHRIVEGDFTQFAKSTELRFDRVLMNPPFRNQQDALHIRAAFGLLKPGGRLVAIASAAVKFRETEAYRWVRENAVSVTDNAADAFKESGTSVKTVIVVLEKA